MLELAVNVQAVTIVSLPVLCQQLVRQELTILIREQLRSMLVFCVHLASIVQQAVSLSRLDHAMKDFIATAAPTAADRSME